MHPIFKADECGAHNWVMVFAADEENPFLQVSQGKSSMVAINTEQSIVSESTDFEILIDDYIAFQNK